MQSYLITDDSLSVVCIISVSWYDIGFRLAIWIVEKDRYQMSVNAFIENIACFLINKIVGDRNRLLIKYVIYYSFFLIILLKITSFYGGRLYLLIVTIQDTHVCWYLVSLYIYIPDFHSSETSLEHKQYPHVFILCFKVNR